MVTTTPTLNSGESSCVFNEGLAIKSLQHIDEPLDPRLGLTSEPYVDGIDSTLGRTLVEKSQPLDEVFYVGVLFTEAQKSTLIIHAGGFRARRCPKSDLLSPFQKMGRYPIGLLLHINSMYVNLMTAFQQFPYGRIQLPLVRLII
jgi:hypothetical protein